ncbi:MAG TPA: BtaA family protein [Balneolales bacterium]|nr:BtaA family protein [Balneolales bacterium]
MRANISSSLINRVRDKVFDYIHDNNLIYNTSWEDPRIDRELLQLNDESRIVMITSAGCNVLDYLLDNPGSIDTVDINNRQNALLELKKAAISTLDHDDFFSLFGNGRHQHIREVYFDILRRHLPNYAQQFWDDKYYYFLPNTENRSFYFRGTSGNLAWLAHKYMKKNKKLWKNIQLLLQASSLDKQREIFDRIEPDLWNAFSRYIVKRSFTMTLLGVPRPQINLIEHEYTDGLYGYIRENLRKVFTEIPIQDNYFWRVYLTGAYTPKCCPEYLKPTNYESLKGCIHRISIHNLTINDFLKRNPDIYTHYILLDHQDWLAWNDPRALSNEWDLILRNSKTGSRILMRSAGNKIDYLQKDIFKNLRFYPELTNSLHKKDRVGTYKSLHFAEVIR